MKDNYQGDSVEAVGDSPCVSKEELIARIASFLRSQKKDFKPQIILDNYLRTYSDRPTLRDIQEVLLLDGAFIRTRSGHYQVKQAVEKPRWEPSGLLEWLIVCMFECARTDWKTSSESQQSRILEFLLMMLDYSDVEAESLRHLIFRLSTQSLTPSSWAKLPQAIPEAFRSLCIIGCVMVANSSGVFSRDGEQNLLRITTHLDRNQVFLQRTITIYSNGISRKCSDDVESYFALELPDESALGRVHSRFAQLSEALASSLFNSYGLDYVLLSERRLRKINEAYRAFPAIPLKEEDEEEEDEEEEDEGDEEEEEEEEVEFSYEGDYLSLAEASEVLGVPKSELCKACRNGQISVSGECRSEGGQPLFALVPELEKWAEEFLDDRKRSVNRVLQAWGQVSGKTCYDGIFTSSKGIRLSSGSVRTRSVVLPRTIEVASLPEKVWAALRRIAGELRQESLRIPGGHRRLESTMERVSPSAMRHLEDLSDKIVEVLELSDGYLPLKALFDIWPEQEAEDVIVCANLASEFYGKIVITQSCVLLSSLANMWKLATETVHLAPVKWDSLVRWMQRESKGLLNSQSCEDLVVYEWGGAILSVDDQEYVASFDSLRTVDILLTVLAHEAPMTRIKLLIRCSRDYERLESTWSDGFEHLQKDPRIIEDNELWSVSL